MYDGLYNYYNRDDIGIISDFYFYKRKIIEVSHIFYKPFISTVLSTCDVYFTSSIFTKSSNLLFH